MKGSMKRLLIVTVVLGCVVTGTVKAQDVDGRKGLTEEQKEALEGLRKSGGGS